MIPVEQEFLDQMMLKLNGLNEEIDAIIVRAALAELGQKRLRASLDAVTKERDELRAQLDLIHGIDGNVQA